MAFAISATILGSERTSGPGGLLQHGSLLHPEFPAPTGVRHATGPFIFFLDSDDEITPQCLDALLEALRRRRRLSIRPSPQADGLPPSWKRWLQAMAESLPASTARASDVIAAVATRPPAKRPPAEQLQGWHALRALWRQQWDPPSRDERGLRAFSRTLSILLHVVFLVIMSWLMHARFMLAPPADAQRGEHVIEVEFIGSGTPEEEGGGAPAEPVAVAVEKDWASRSPHSLPPSAVRLALDSPDPPHFLWHTGQKKVDRPDCTMRRITPPQPGVGQGAPARS